MRARQPLAWHALGVFVLAILLVLSPAATSSRAYAGVDFAVAALSFGSELPSRSVSPSSTERVQRQASAHSQRRAIVAQSGASRAGIAGSEGAGLAAPRRDAPEIHGADLGLYLQFCAWLC